MISLLFFTLLTSVFATETVVPTCIVGAPEDKSLVKIFNDEKNPDNGPIRIWRALDRNRAKDCETPARPVSSSHQAYLPDIMDLRRKIRRNWSAYPTLSTDCVIAAMRSIDTGVMKVQTVHKANTKALPSPNCVKRGKKMVCPTDAQICDLDDNTKKIRSGSSPCVTRDMADYVAWMLDQGIRCLSPDEDPMDARTLFRKLNNESQFGFFINNVNGKGLHQLVDIAQREMLAPERGYGEVIQPIVDLMGTKGKDGENAIRQKACEPFREVLAKTEPIPLRDKQVLDPCNLLQPGLGVARSVLLGLGTFVHMTHTYFIYEKENGRIVRKNVSTNQLVTEAGLDPIHDENARELRDLLSMSYYSSAGPRGGIKVFRETAEQLNCEKRNTKTCSSANMVQAFRANMSRYYQSKKKPNYFEKIDLRFKGLLKLMDGGAKSSPAQYSPAEIRGDRCVE
ncbi:MAG: hypothetical protein AB7N80_15990 [Bdellovibrionales bacterium]